MDYPANIHQLQEHHHQQQHLLVTSTTIASSPCSSSSLIPSCYAAGTTHAAWTPTPILNNTSSLSACSNGSNDNNMLLLSSSLESGNMTHQDFLGFNCATNSTNHPPGNAYDLLARLKNETTSDSYSSSSHTTTSYLKNEAANKDLMNQEKLLGRHLVVPYGFQLSSEDSSSSSLSSNNNGSSVAAMAPNRAGGFGQIFPNHMNEFNVNHQMCSSGLDMNFQALDLLNSARFSEGFGQISSHRHGSFLKGGFPPYGSLDPMQLPSIRSPLTSPNNHISNFSDGAAEGKRGSIILEPKASHQPPPKKSRIESRASCPPFNVMKVRKEKLGDRIAALQQMVAPFGKTDTASVLMEAIGYIKFLQNQVETLSVPYMKPSRDKNRVMMQGVGSNIQGSPSGIENNEEPKLDLRSRGLCLVPVSCLSYVADGGGGVWPSPPPPPNYGGGGI